MLRLCAATAAGEAHEGRNQELPGAHVDTGNWRGRDSRVARCTIRVAECTTRETMSTERSAATNMLQGISFITTRRNFDHNYH